jgi:hypothetical protein
VRFGTIHIVLVIVAVVLAAGASVWLFYEPPEGCKGSTSGYYVGSLYVNEAGSPKGDSNYTALYNADLTTQDGAGGILFNYVSGDGDRLAQHVYNVSGLCDQNGHLEFSADGNTFEMPLDYEDLIWDGNYSGYFIASWGPQAGPEEKRGTIFARYFPGIAEFSYVELRLQST